MFILRHGENYRTAKYIGVYTTQEELDKAVNDWLDKNSPTEYVSKGYIRSSMTNGITTVDYGSHTNFLFSEAI